MRGRYFLLRLLQGLAVIVGVTVIVFVVTHMLGDPARKMLPLDATEEEYLAFRSRLGYDRPLAAQFAEFATGMVRLDFGNSLWRNRPARALVLERLPATLVLVVSSQLLAILISIPLGIIAALRPGSWLDRTTVTVSLVGLSLPQFWLGAMLIMVFAVRLGWLPTSGLEGPQYLILPTLALALPLAGRITQVVRSGMIEELQKQHIVAAVARGLSYYTILVRHALRTALVPIVAFLSWETARALAGTTVIVETVFAYPGVGYLAMQAIRRDDIPLLQADVFIVALLVVATNIAFDALYGVVDPRIRSSS
jgi:peptide/nickel transport system permease protein